MIKYIRFLIHIILAIIVLIIFDGLKYQNLYIALALAFLNIILYLKELFKRDIWFTNKKDRMWVVVITFIIYFLFYFAILLFI